MRRIHSLRLASRLVPAACFALALAAASCDKTIDAPEIQPLVPVSADATGGTWKPVLLPADSIPQLSAPLDAASAGYMAELQQVQTLQSGLTSQMESDIKYWAGGGVVRWNQIARNLVIKYNVAPPVGAAPNPMKPFANPPIASRAYALLSVAQYDALVAAWNNRYLHNRQAPYKANSAIRAVVPITDAPSYPSEHAVIAAASAEILKFVFPADSAMIFQKKQNHQESRMWAGANVASEIKAGDSLGKLIAQRVIARAKTDGTGAARGGDTLFTDKSGWVSLETPPRPPMLPLWGKVKLWVTPSVELVRADPPPAVGSAEFNAALAEVKHYSENRTREEWRISDFWADGAGTTTPPGHWNIIAEELILKNRMNELRTARTMALLNMAMMDAGISCWDAKYFYNIPRPSQVDPTITTATGIPNFPSYTSGHSSFSAAAAEVLCYLFPADETKLRQMAEEAALSRLYGCIHYRFDCDAGNICGKRVGEFAVNLGKADGSPAN
jgi:hypothetical protein